MLNELGGASQSQGVVGGNIIFSDKEIELMMNIWAECAIGYNKELDKTTPYYQIHRKNLGQKPWEMMSVEDRKKEFLKELSRDLLMTSLMLGKDDAVSFLLYRAYNPLDPMAGFYKGLLVKLGATIAEDGLLKVPASLSERLDNYLHNRKIMDISSSQAAIDESMKQKIDGLKLSLRLKLD